MVQLSMESDSMCPYFKQQFEFIVICTLGSDVSPFSATSPSPAPFPAEIAVPRQRDSPASPHGVGLRAEVDGSKEVSGGLAGSEPHEVYVDLQVKAREKKQIYKASIGKQTNEEENDCCDSYAAKCYLALDVIVDYFENLAMAREELVVAAVEEIRQVWGAGTVSVKKSNVRTIATFIYR